MSSISFRVSLHVQLEPNRRFSAFLRFKRNETTPTNEKRNEKEKKREREELDGNLKNSKSSKITRENDKRQAGFYSREDRYKLISLEVRLAGQSYGNRWTGKWTFRAWTRANGTAVIGKTKRNQTWIIQADMWPVTRYQRSRSDYYLSDGCNSCRANFYNFSWNIASLRRAWSARKSVKNVILRTMTFCESIWTLRVEIFCMKQS